MANFGGPIWQVRMTAAPQKPKHRKSERLKRAMNPWEGLAEIRRFAREGFESIPPEWIGTYFRWWGVYTQGDGAGVIGGKAARAALPFFMLRIRIPNGLLRSDQLRTIADLTRRYARGTADLTVRQNIQLHWVTIEALPEVLEELWRVGLNTTGACGDVTRNITGCPVAGVDADEICDASSLALEADRMLAGNAEFYNLPRKFKISITGCRVWCPYPEINDVGLTAIKRVVRGKPEIGFACAWAADFPPSLIWGAVKCVRSLESGASRWSRGVAELFRDSEPIARTSRASAAEISLPAAWLDAGRFSERTGAADRISIRSRRARASARGCLSRPHRHPSAKTSRSTATWELRCCAAESRRNKWMRPPTSPNASPAANCAPPTCKTCSSSTFRRLAGRRVGQRIRRDRTARERRRRSFAAPSPAAAREFCKLAITETKSFLALAGGGTGRAPCPVLIST